MKILASSRINKNLPQTFLHPRKMDFPAVLNGKLNYTKWVALIDLYKVICNTGGLIYGGVPRDYIKRTSASKKFNEYFHEPSQNFDDTLYKDKYNDKTCQEDTYNDRTLLPNDIDIYITETNFEKLIKELNNQYYINEIDTSRKQICYFMKSNELFRNALIFKRYYVNFLSGKTNRLSKLLFGDDIIEQMGIKIEFVILKDEFVKHQEAYDGGLLYPPFGNPDYDINQLGMLVVDDNIEIKVFNSLLRYEINTYIAGRTLIPLDIMDIKYRVLKEVINNITNSIAIPLFPNIQQIRKVYGEDYQPHINYKRFIKMCNKGYAINGEMMLTKYKHIKCAPKDYINNDDDKCIICLDIFTDKKKWFNFGCICNVKMHIECYAKYIRNPTLTENYTQIICPHCRTPNHYECSCKIMNFMSSLNHCIKRYDSDEECNKCIRSSPLQPCLIWYHKCKVCE